MKVGRLLASAILTAVAQCEYITKDNYDATVKGRAVLLQFTITFEACGACDQSQSKWDSLTQNFGSSQEVAVGQVTCDTSTSAEELCHDFMDSDALAPYPSVWYGHPYTLRRYYGAKSYEALVEVAASLRAPCSPWRLDRCQESEKAKVALYLSLSDQDLDELIMITETEVTEELKQVEEQFERKREAILKRLDAYQVQAMGKVDEILASIATARSVVVHRRIPDPSSPLDQLLGDGSWTRYGSSTLDDEEELNLLYDDEYYDRSPEEIYREAEEYIEQYAAGFGFTPADDAYYE